MQAFSYILSKFPKRFRLAFLLLFFSAGCFGCVEGGSSSQEKEAAPIMKREAGNPVYSWNGAYKLVFIHHSVGGHWLAHGDGDLVRELNRNNIYVNDITYGWEPEELVDSPWKRAMRKVLSLTKKDKSGAYNIGDRTDIGQMHDWFSGPDSAMIMAAVYKENSETDRFGDHGNDPTLRERVAGMENEIVMFKSCYPNTLLKGSPADKANAGSDPPRNFTAGSDLHTVANAKRVFNDSLRYFRSRPDKFFVIVTPPPRLELPESGRIARGFANWLRNDWLKENDYRLNNVMVFDLYNVLTSGDGPDRSDLGAEGGNHHRLWEGKEQHLVAQDRNILAYPRKPGDNHPSSAGLKKATAEFVPLLMEKLRLWKEATAEEKVK